MNTLRMVIPSAKYFNYGKSLSSLEVGFIGNRLTKWLRQKLWNWITNGGAYEYTSEKVEYTEFCLDTNEFMHKLRLGRRDIEGIFREDIKYIVVGRDEQYRLINKALDHRFDFPVESHIACGGETKICGLTVICVPWLNGIALLPELQKSEKRDTRWAGTCVP